MVATGGGGLLDMPKASGEFDVTSGLPSEFSVGCLSITRDGKTYLWAGTEGGALLVWS